MAYTTPSVEEQEDKKKKTRKILLILLIVFLVVLTLFSTTFCLFVIFGGWGSGITIGGSGDRTDLGVDEDVGDGSKKAVAIPGYPSFTIPAGVTEVTSAEFYNPSANKDLYYLTYELKLVHDDGSRETLYKSALVPPGMQLTKITLSRQLSAGVYDAEIFVQPYKMSDKTATNNAIMKTTLIVK